MRSHVHDSNGPNIRVRGNSYQVMEKYLAMARDAASAGDRIAAENYYQHAEHYFRVLNASGTNGSHERQHQMHTPSDPNAGDDLDGDDDGEQPRHVDARTPDVHDADPVPRAVEPLAGPNGQESRGQDARSQDTRGQGDREQGPRRRGPNGRRRHGTPDSQGSGDQPSGRAPRDPRSISPGSPAEAAVSDGDAGEPDDQPNS